MPAPTNPEHGDDSDLLDFSFASLPTLSPSLSAKERRALREVKRLAASHAFRCAELDGRDPASCTEAARVAAAKIGGASC